MLSLGDDCLGVCIPINGCPKCLEDFADGDEHVIVDVLRLRLGERKLLPVQDNLNLSKAARGEKARDGKG